MARRADSPGSMNYMLCAGSTWRHMANTTDQSAWRRRCGQTLPSGGKEGEGPTSEAIEGAASLFNKLTYLLTYLLKGVKGGERGRKSRGENPRPLIHRLMLSVCACVLAVLAAGCIRNLRQTFKYGGRQTLPSKVEILAASVCPSLNIISYLFTHLRYEPLKAFFRFISFYRAMLCTRGTSHGPVSVCVRVCYKSVFYGNG